MVWDRTVYARLNTQIVWAAVCVVGLKQIIMKLYYILFCYVFYLGDFATNAKTQQRWISFSYGMLVEACTNIN